MAIVKMDKFSLLSFNDKRSSLLNILQNFNYVHFNDLKLKEDESYLKEVENSAVLNSIEEKQDKLKYAVETAKKYSNEDLPNDLKRLDIENVYRQSENFDFNLIYDKLLKLVKEREGLVDKKQANDTRIQDLSPWKDVNLNINDLYESERVFVETGSISSQFYDSLRKELVEKHLEKSLVYKLSERDKISYIVGIASLDEKEEFNEILREFGFTRIRIKAEGPVGEELEKLKANSKKYKNDISKLEEEIGGFAKYMDDFYLYESFLENEKKKEASVENFLKTKSMDVIEGFVPSDMAETFKKDLTSVLGEEYILDIGEADLDDPDVPIILDNNSVVEPFESVVETYALPRYNEIDPSLLVAIFYTIFTGFMIGDLGYGILGVIGTIFLLKKKDFPKSSEKMVKLFLAISLSACFFGILFGSVFGGIIEVPFGWIDTQKDVYTLIGMSFAIGTVALMVSVGMTIVIHLKNNRPLDAIYDSLFTYLFLGGIGYYVYSKSKIGLYVMAAGMVGILLFSGRDAKTIGGRLGSGFYNVYGLTSWIGDFVSFLRLMALVLSGGFVAYAVNVIVKMVGGAGFFGLLGGIIIFVIFQIFNMFLSYLSAYVHGLRLIYVEMFNKFYEGGGVKFREMLEDTKKIIINKRRK
ncbi:V-type ATP synthase subunit I [Anaerococcus degeneri]|uniref:V-type ATP synthase subunit I n=1 Tax=Anaerococcus degeneri TaxID=361500 RepID=A0ABS7YXU5_9FIRM|nr:V-type ATP synthase subunit I [Anaerococcus degeneri]MBP2015364.1 V/A-type H+-transporting ATPase subunit I [Anaerococcus degeneri]MCA2096260.1 V-type ATP synthase subunit I [Anaerococcus degeneri]